VTPIWPYPGARVLSAYRLMTGDTVREATGTVLRCICDDVVEVAFRGTRLPGTSPTSWCRVTDTYTRWLRPAPGLRVVRARRRRR